MLDHWTELLESWARIDVIYTDLEKTLISYSYQVNDGINLWIVFSYCRKQRAKIDEVLSQWSDVPSGIPQGSILWVEPILFIIHMNDLIESCGDDCKICLFADDARLYNHIKSRADAVALQSKSNNFTNWSDKWLVKLNTKKCKVMSFHHHHSVRYAE